MFEHLCNRNLFNSLIPESRINFLKCLRVAHNLLRVLPREYFIKLEQELRIFDDPVSIKQALVYQDLEMHMGHDPSISTFFDQSHRLQPMFV
jgi:hypothetical protein